MMISAFSQKNSFYFRFGRFSWAITELCNILLFSIVPQVKIYCGPIWSQAFAKYHRTELIALSFVIY